MATLTIRLSNDKHQRLRLLAKRRQVYSMNKLMEELSTVALVQFSTPKHAFVRACGKRVGQEGPVSALDKLDKASR